jgi:DNA polymerase-3 subunit gamma/tau
MANDTEFELYKKYRPTNWDQLVGQEGASRQLSAMLTNNKIPRTILITGPSGCGKTTIARIIKEMLVISDQDYQEIDCADNNGIDMVRDIKRRIHASPLNGKWRMFLLDECHQLTAAAQDSLLKVLEDTPKHVIFVLNTTNAQKLKETIKTRCTDIQVKSFTTDGLTKIIRRVCKKEKINLSDDVRDMIITASDGSARKALVILHQIQDLENEDDQKAAILKSDVQAVGIDLARKLMDLRSTWGDIAKVLKSIEQDAEGVRRCVLGYASAIILNQSKPSKISARAALVLEAFESNVFDSGKAGLVLMAYNVFGIKS